MKEDIEKFRKLAKAMLSDEALTKDDILKTMGISAPTLEKLLLEDLSTISVRASVLGAAQDFCKAYRDYTYSEPEGEVLPKTGKDKRVAHEDPKPVHTPEAIWGLLAAVEKALPPHMRVKITIKK